MEFVQGYGPSRARFLATAGAAATLLGPARSLAQELTTLRITAVPNDDVSPLLYAQQSGLFRRAGLDIQLTANSSGAAIAAAVAGGAYDIGLGSMMALVAGHLRGIPFVMIAPSLLYLSNDPVGQMLVLKDSPIRSPRDLGGKLLSVAAIRDISWVATLAWADRFGVDSSMIKFVEVPQSALAAALDQKRIDAAFVLIPTLEDALATGHFRSIGALLDGIGPRWMVAAWFANADFVTKNRDVVNRFAEVMRTATVFANTHPAETAPLIAAFTHIDPARVAQMKRVTCGEYLDPRDIQPAIDAAAKYKAIERGFPAQELISPYALKPPGR